MSSLLNVQLNSEPEKHDSSLLKYSNTDPLALSCCRYRKMKDKESKASLYTVDQYSHITADDYEQANSIRSYYRGRLTEIVLKGSQLSKFRQDLAQFVSEQLVDYRSFEGMIYRLPEFYDYDQQLDRVIERFQPTTGPLPELNPRRPSGERNTSYWDFALKPAFRFNRSASRRTMNKSVHYWMYDLRGEHMVRFVLSIDNPVSVLWDDMWDRAVKHEEEICVRGIARPMKFDAVRFIILNQLTEVL